MLDAGRRPSLRHRRSLRLSFAWIVSLCLIWLPNREAGSAEIKEQKGNLLEKATNIQVERTAIVSRTDEPITEALSLTVTSTCKDIDPDANQNATAQNVCDLANSSDPDIPESLKNDAADVLQMALLTCPPANPDQILVVQSSFLHRFLKWLIVFVLDLNPDDLVVEKTTNEVLPANQGSLSVTHWDLITKEDFEDQTGETFNDAFVYCSWEVCVDGAGAAPAACELPTMDGVDVDLRPTPVPAGSDWTRMFLISLVTIATLMAWRRRRRIS